MKNSTSESGSGLHSTAAVSMFLRVAVAGYLLYLDWKLLSAALNGSSPISLVVTILLCAVFAAAAIGFIIYALLMYRRSVKAAAAQALPKSDDHSQNEK